MNRSRRALQAAFYAVFLAAALAPAPALHRPGAAETVPSVPPVVSPEEWDADIAMRLGEHEYLGGDVTAALASFRSAAAKDPRRAEAHWRVSHCLAVMDRLPEALAALERARARAPDDPRILNTLAVVQMKAGDLKNAADSARRAVRQAPRVADVWDTVGWVYFYMGELERSRSAFETALKLDRNHSSARQGLARVSAR